MDKFGTRIKKLEKILKSKMKKTNTTFKMRISAGGAKEGCSSVDPSSGARGGRGRGR